jgi:cyclase
MLKNRVIPSLLVSERRLVKTRRFRNPQYVGDPINAVRIFNEKEVDEILILDIDASKSKSDPDFDYIKQLASECFMPICYGGGISSVDHAAKIFDLGVEKIVLQSAVIDNCELVTNLSERFGSQSIVCSVDVRRNWLNKTMLFESRTGKPHKTHWLDYASRVTSAGAGELLLNAVDRDGELCGYDLGIIQAAANVINVPLVALGGARNLVDFRAAVDAGASAVAAGAMFVFHGPHRAVLITYPLYADLEKIFG